MSGKLLVRASALSLAIFLAACGGDENSTPIVNVGTGGGSPTEEGSPSTAEPGTETPSTGTPETPDASAPPSTLAIGTGTGSAFSAGALGLENATITSGSSTELKFNIVDTEANNSLAVNINQPNTIIFTSACLDSDRASITAPSEVTSGTVLATYDSGTCIGTDTVYAFLNDSTEIYGSAPITVTAPQEVDLALGTLNGITGAFAPNSISASSTQTLPIGSSVRLSVDIVEQISQDHQVGQPFTVQFSAQCTGSENGSSFSQANVSTTTGTAETIYTVGACASQTEEQIVYAQLIDQDGVELAQTSIKTDPANAFQLVAGTPTPQSIAPSFLSQEDRESTAIIRFTLKDSTVLGNGIEGKTINLRIDEPNVAEFVSSDGATTDSLSLSTDAQGQISVAARAKKGIDHQVFRIIASHDNLETISMPVAVNSKLPYEPKFSISTTDFAPDVQGKDGVRVELTVLAADDEGNRIRGNTPVNFSTTEGSIDPDCQLDNEGRCTVTWESLSIRDFQTQVTATTHGRRSDNTIGTISDNVTMLMSTSDGVQVELTRTVPDSATDITEESNKYCANTWVLLPNRGTTKSSPPTGTTIEFNLVEGEFVSEATASTTIGSDERLLATSGFTSCTEVKPQVTVEQIPDGSGGTTEQTTLSVVLGVTVTPPGENSTPATALISEQAQF